MKNIDAVPVSSFSGFIIFWFIKTLKENYRHGIVSLYLSFTGR